ncbi:MAG: nuclear transport factor 2 family protein [Chloroflexia bacterium]|nr:nuclear transport factor 2 family protein [Chloroflexia bacterium]
MHESIILNWHEAVNSANLERLRDTVSDLVVVTGPKGGGAISADAFMEWVTRSGVRLQPVNWRPVTEGIVVVEQDATWPDAPDPVRVATMFRVRGGRVSAALRFPDLEQALTFATLYAALAETA